MISWDHNYTTNSLEVKARNGRVVLKTVLFEDRVQIEGEWWNEEGLGIRMLSPPHKPEISDSQYVKLNPVVDPDDPKISEMFQYPSYSHFSELNGSRRRWLDKFFIFKALGGN
jgi:hypothetical protein